MLTLKTESYMLQKLDALEFRIFFKFQKCNSEQVPHK